MAAAASPSSAAMASVRYVRGLGPPRRTAQAVTARPAATAVRVAVVRNLMSIPVTKGENRMPAPRAGGFAWMLLYVPGAAGVRGGEGAAGLHGFPDRGWPHGAATSQGPRGGAELMMAVRARRRPEDGPRSARRL